jgi:hypothetical protein
MLNVKSSALLLSLLLLSACGAGSSSPSIGSVTPPPEVTPTEPEVVIPPEPEVPTYTPVEVLKPKKLCIYYGQPDLINGTSPVYLKDETGTVYDVQVTAAAAEFSQCGLVVFGDGLAADTHPAHYNTQLIMYSLAEKGIPIFGYVDAGVSTQNLSLTEAQNRIALWQKMGVNGIFLDDFGFDYGTSRSRQNALVDAVHAQKLGAFINAFHPDEVFGDKNESGVVELPKLTAEDYYLAENWLYEDGALTPAVNWFDKSLKLETYLKTYPVHLAATATTAATQATGYDAARDAWKYAYWGAVLQRAEYFQWTDGNFSATNNQLYFYAAPTNFPVGAAFTNTLTKVSDAKGFAIYTRAQDVGSITIYGDSLISAGVKVE